MKRHFLKLLGLWIVPLLIARSLIPAGYMLSVGAAGLELTFCPTVVTPTTAATTDHSQHMAHAAHQDAAQHAGHHAGHDANGGAQEHAACPFALVAGGALPEAPFLTATTFVVAEHVVDFTSAPAVSAGPIRTDRIRGPPALS